MNHPPLKTYRFEVGVSSNRGIVSSRLYILQNFAHLFIISRVYFKIRKDSFLHLNGTTFRSSFPSRESFSCRAKEEE